MNRNDYQWKDDRELFCFHPAAIPYLSYRCLDDLGFVRNAFTQRYSESGEAVKLFWHEGEDPEIVAEFNAQLAKQLGTDPRRRVAAQQKHTANVHVVREADLGSSLVQSHLENTDALVSNIPDSLLCVSVADCIPLMFADPVKKAIGIAHSGRKGTMSRIGAAVVRTMQKEYGSAPQDIIATVGPGICRDCYEVGPEILEEFLQEWGPEKTGRIFSEKGEKYDLDLWEANRIVLEEAGLLPGHIVVTNLCNRCNSDKFYSFRADGRIINQISASLLLVGSSDSITEKKRG